MTIALGGIAAAVAWSLPSYYSAEARVLVGRAIAARAQRRGDHHRRQPRRERVQNEGFVLQSRTLAKMVIDKLKLADNPAFIRPCASPRSGRAHSISSASCRPRSTTGWRLAHQATGGVTPVVDASLSRATTG